MRIQPQIYNAVDLSRLTALSDDLRNRTMKAKTGTGEKWYRITNDAPRDRAKIYIYDMIGEWGVTASDFVNELNSLNSRHIDLHLNCQGGHVFDGLAMYAALRNHAAEVTVYVDALAASAASFIAQAGNKRIMEPNARMMIHDAQGLCIGNADAARELANLLDDASNNIADIYAERSNTDQKTWRKAMKNETWYSAEEAVSAGLADEVAGQGDNTTNSSSVADNITDVLEWDNQQFISLMKECVA
jgi:ATP-dependent protease ClpP protease subunit